MIKFGGRCFSLLAEPEISDKVGRYSDIDGTMTVCRSGDMGVRELAFLEEAIHMVDETMGFDLDHKIIKLLAFGVQSFLHQNTSVPPDWFEKFYDDNSKGKK